MSWTDKLQRQFSAIDEVRRATEQLSAIDEMRRATGQLIPNPGSHDSGQRIPESASV